jgi:hypothetical protein
MKSPKANLHNGHAPVRAAPFFLLFSTIEHPQGNKLLALSSAEKYCLCPRTLYSLICVSYGGFIFE